MGPLVVVPEGVRTIIPSRLTAVRAHGFPAMHRSGAAVTYFSRQPPGNADGPLSSWLVETALATGSTTVHDIVDDSGWIGEEDADQCPDDRQDLEERIRKANERLQDYRTLPELDVVGDMPEWMYEDREPQVRAVPGRLVDCSAFTRQRRLGSGWLSPMRAALTATLTV